MVKIDDLITQAQAATLVGSTRQAINKAIRRGALKVARTVAGTPLLDPDAVREWAAEPTKNTGRPKNPKKIYAA